VCFCLKFGRPLRGSFLLEIAIAISIIGLISGFFITKTIITSKAVREQITRSNISIVSIALASFVANNSRLPRPSIDRNGHECEESETNYVGKIPFYTLGISAKNAMDGNGRPLVYIVEPFLTFNFSHIYDTNVDRCFCSGISSPKISVDKISTSFNSIIAFVIDTEDNLPAISEKIHVTVSKNTHWISRDMILMQYLKNSPCRREENRPQHAVENTTNTPQRTNNPFDFF
jgi:hypothetical protein